MESAEADLKVRLYVRRVGDRAETDWISLEYVIDIEIE